MWYTLLDIYYILITSTGSYLINIPWGGEGVIVTICKVQKHSRLSLKGYDPNVMTTSAPLSSTLKVDGKSLVCQEMVFTE